MELYPLKVFQMVATEKSFSRAAEKLLRTQPAVSLAIQRLETELDEKLIDRSGKELMLTDAGQRFLVHAKGILHQLDGARHAVTGSEADLAGKVVIGLPPSIGQVLTVPVQAVVGSAGMGKTRKVFVATPNGVEEREVVIGASSDTHAEIKEGLKEGEEVVVNPRVIVGDKEKTRSGPGAGKDDDSDDDRRGPGAGPKGSPREGDEPGTLPKRGGMDKGGLKKGGGFKKGGGGPPPAEPPAK